MASYFVRNSVFRLLNGPTASSVSVSVQAGATTAAIDASTTTSTTTTHTASTSTAEPEVHAVPTPAPVAEAVVAIPVAAAAPVHVHVPEATAVEVPHASVVETAHTDAPAPVAAPEPSVPSVPKSYSDMARAGAIAQATASPARLPMRPSSARPTSTLKVQEFAGPGSSKQPATAAGPSLSLYVKQVPENASEQDVLALFGRFGTVKRVELNGQRGFAFVDYESASSVQSCLLSTKESALELLGSALKVEERNSRGGGGPGGNSTGGRSKSGVRREGDRDNRDRREGGRGEGGRGSGGGREGGGGGDRERRDRDRRGPKPDGTNGNGAASGSKISADASVRAKK